MSGNSGSILSTTFQNRTNSVLVGLLVVFLAVFGGITVYVNILADRDDQYLEHAGELRVLSQELAKNATEAAGGKQAAFSELKQARNSFAEHWNYLIKGDSATGLPPAEMAAMTDVGALWNTVRTNADQIVRAEDVILSLHEVAATLAETIPQLQVEYDEIVEILLDNDAPADQVAVAQRQSWLAERIVRSVNKVLAGGEDAVMAADAFGRDASLFGRVLNGMIQGNVAMGISQVTDEEAVYALAEVAELFEFVSGSVDEILETSPELFQVREASDSIFSDSETLLNQTSSLTQTIQDGAATRFFLQLVGYLAGVAALVVIVLLVVVSNRTTRRDLEETADKNEQNQMAILRLLDEIADLADGDLTASATVTEDFTGAIADSINYAIDQMRSLVFAINETAVQVSSAAQETQATAMHLAEASEHQAQEIAGASAAINEMAVSIDQVSANASESSAVAERSVAIANKGAEVVQATINGMDNIREQIQETSKRIKRLGESSQEIGDIISLITDIADQTNILSLNA
ncbi:MAG: chemotaxis protein, partial [Oleibacter sp.]|nr:chemotaxis protein [Thalassolituus sp.]